ncbi:recombinase family protein [Vibrio metschnikovii]|uniref:Recombinase family protein n=1 Tax=bacterium 19MO03SA05 TaxID=2920620 RepID=A0AAU6VK26_UNCXX|nr:recombinase family protein [Vibrio metschnikovii]EKO3601095.1 recombinase family protein [Vibrio metschnikovii]EKO3774657.1 recombinase family protein [Vibrio metschnikovii]EKO3781291.1 recombinase family protein [Vibrio metschnikovii]EKO3888272.1 recombinase family protein [Vibrio metschnikovii]EKO3892363.1 recombinase family protein [Vibrio metschnikovii]
MFIRGYLRASTDEQDAHRAKSELIQFAKQKGVRIASFYTENQSGSKLERAELSRLIEDSHQNDILLIEKVDRLSRLPYEQWKLLKHQLVDAGIHIVVLDQPMTHSILNGIAENSMISKVLTEFMIDLAAAMARDDYETRQKRQAQGIEKAKALGKYQGRQPDHQLRKNIALLLGKGKSWSKIQSLLGCSRSTVAKVKNLTN